MRLRFSAWRRAAQGPVFLLAALLAGAAAAPSAAPAPGAVRRIPLDPAPRWLASLAWDGSGNRLVLAEGGRGGSFLIYDAGGKLLQRLSAAGLGISNPVHLTALPGGFFLNDFPRRLVWTDDRLSPSRSLDLGEHVPPGKGTVSSFWSWAVTPAATIYSLSDVQRGPGLWKNGYLRIKTAPAVDFDYLREVPKSPDRLDLDLCRSGYPCAAALGERGYFLVQSDPPAIHEASPSWRALKGFPPRYARRPRLPLLEGARGYPLFMRAIERSALALGLYARGSALFLLARSPLPAGRTRWELFQIDPQTDRIISSKTLPTAASHVAIAPGPRFWAIVEQGPVEAQGKQETLGLLLLPTREVEAQPGQPER